MYASLIRAGDLPLPRLRVHPREIAIPLKIRYGRLTAKTVYHYSSLQMNPTFAVTLLVAAILYHRHTCAATILAIDLEIQPG